MSKIEVDQIDPQSGTNLTIGTSGDTIKTGTGTSLVVQGDGSSANGLITLNCSQNSHGVKLSSPDHSGGQSYTMKLPATNITAGKFLKVDSITGSGATAVGQLSFVDEPGGGSLVKLQSQTASSASTVTFTSTYLTSTYKVYQLHCTAIDLSQDGGNIGIQTSTDNGSSYETAGNYKNVRKYSRDDTSTDAIKSGHGNGDDRIRILGTGYGVGTNSNEGGVSIITIFDPLGTGKGKFFKCEGCHFDENNKLVVQEHTFALDQSAAINNFKIIPASGTFSGTFTLYGVE